MSHANKALARRYFDEIWSGGALSAVDEVFGADYVGHDPANPGVKGPDGMRAVVATFRGAFPDIRLTVDAQFADGDTVTTRWTAAGTHKGDLRGIAPTGKPIKITGIHVHRIAGGKIVEAWANWDTLGLMQQIGIIPAPK
jgi:steroid delta-isomerase-like uncharacterized protein